MSIYEYKHQKHRLNMTEVRELEYLIVCYKNGTRSEKDCWTRFLEIMRGEARK